MRLFVALLFCSIFASTFAIPTDQSNQNKKKSRAFSLFSVVKFDNVECTTSNADKNTFGMCLTTTECTDRGGTHQGNCASGFGACCYVKVDQTACGGSISNNISYIENTGFPTATTAASIDCTYTLKTTTNICQIRLDFATVVLGPPHETDDTSLGKCNSDSLTVTSPGSGYFLTPLCGTLTKTHMYVETARKETAATIQIKTGTSTTVSRSWKIKTIFLECETSWKAPTDCLQYLTGVSGSFRSFNFGSTMIRNLQYDVCIRPEKGYCRFQLMESSTAIVSFKLDPVGTSGMVGTNCDNQFITVNGYTHFKDQEVNTNTKISNRFCGSKLSIIDADTTSGVLIGDGPRMSVGIFTTNVDANNGPDTGTKGFDLTYVQLPCA